MSRLAFIATFSLAAATCFADETPAAPQTAPGTSANPATEQQAAAPASQVHFSMDQDGRSWKVAYEESNAESSIKEYILNNETIENWSELVTVHFFKDIDISPEKYFELFIDELKKSAPEDKIESKIISKDDHSIFGEWWIQGSKNDDQHEWIRIFSDGKNLAILRYTSKKTDNDDTKKKWESIIKSATFGK